MISGEWDPAKALSVSDIMYLKELLSFMIGDANNNNIDIYNFFLISSLTAYTQNRIQIVIDLDELSFVDPALLDIICYGIKEIKSSDYCSSSNVIKFNYLLSLFPSLKKVIINTNPSDIFGYKEYHFHFQCFSNFLIVLHCTNINNLKHCK